MALQGYEDGVSQQSLRYLKKDKAKEESWLVRAKKSAFDKQTGTSFGRTPKSWFQLSLFYLTLFVIIAIIWIIHITIFNQTIDERVPKFRLSESLIGTNPGVGIRPRPPSEYINSGLISFRSSFNGDWQYWVDDITNYLKPYQELESGAGQHAQGDCNSYGERDPDKFCPFDLRVIPNECTESQNYSYNLGKPCILVKLNRIYGWKPEPYTKKPKDYPLNAPFKEDMVQITCDGQSSVDRENIGPLEYYPQGIDPKYFPFTNQPGYQSPFVMVHFKNPRPGVLIFIECKAWAENIKHDRAIGRGMYSFELLID